MNADTKTADQPTPGPWATYTSDDGARNVKGPDSQFVCTFGCRDSARADPRVEADGRLIVAAPALLSAAQEFVARLERVGIPNDDEPYVDALRAAIAQATRAA